MGSGFQVWVTACVALAFLSYTFLDQGSSEVSTASIGKKYVGLPEHSGRQAYLLKDVCADYKLLSLGFTAGMIQSSTTKFESPKTRIPIKGFQL